MPTTWQKLRTGYSFLSVSLLGFLIFVLLPVLASLLLSFFKWELRGLPQFHGLGNYRQLARDPLFWKVLWHTIYYALGVVPFGMIVSLALALLLNQKLKFTKFYRSAFFLPVVTSTVAAALLWQWLYEPNFGLINYVLDRIGLFIRSSSSTAASVLNLPVPVWLRELHLPRPDWLGDEHLAMPSIILMSIWKTAGYNMVIFLAGLHVIPQMYY